MRPFKSGKGFAIWLLRIALIVMVYVLYANTVSSLAFKSPSFLIAGFILLFSILIVAGGLLNKTGLTVISGLLVFLLSGYKMFVSFNGTLDYFVISQFVPVSLGFFFFTHGNENL
jgi:hypothetical protein